jgi:hypothetical protein
MVDDADNTIRNRQLVVIVYILLLLLTVDIADHRKSGLLRLGELHAGI